MVTLKSPTAERIWNRLRNLPLISLVFVFSACTYAVQPNVQPLPPIESVAVVSKGATDELKARFGVTEDNSSVGTGAAAGMGVGAAAAIGVSAACGPFFLICALGSLPAGMLVGGVGGAGVGATVDTQKKPTEEQMLALDKLFIDISQQRTLHQDIQDALRLQIPTDRLMDSDDAEVLLQLSLSDVRFTQNAAGEYALTLKATMQAQWNRGKRQFRTVKNRNYQAASRALLIEDWVQDQGETLNLAFDACIEDLTEQMVEHIQFSESGGDAPGRAEN